MRTTFIIIFMAFSFFRVFSQKIISPVKWNFEIVQGLDHNYKILATATIDKGWVLYSQFTSDEGPIPTSFSVQNEDVTFVEDTEVIKEMDEVFEVEVLKFKKEAKFSYSLPDIGQDHISGYVMYMTCDGARCLSPVKAEFNFNLRN